MADVTQEKKEFIRLKKDTILRIGIEDANGNDTGEHLEFDLEDIELPLRIKKCEIEHRKNVQNLQMQYRIIDKKQDKKGKYILSWKEEEKLKVLKEFYLKEMEALDLFLGEGGTKKLLNGRRPYYTMYDDFIQILEPVMSKFELKADDIKKKIIDRYKQSNEDKKVLK